LTATRDKGWAELSITALQQFVALRRNMIVTAPQHYPNIVREDSLSQPN